MIGIVALTDLLPEIAFDVLNGGNNQPFRMGLFKSRGGDNLTGRAIYRFNILRGMRIKVLSSM